MLDEKKSTLHFGTLRHAQGGALSLLPLTLALIEAEKESPARAPRRPTDVDEELARRLVQKMRKEYRKFHVVARSAVCDDTVVALAASEQ